MTHTLPGYRVERQLRRGRTTAVHEAVRESDGLAVIAKFYAAPAEGDASDARFEHEFALLQDLGVPGTARAVDLVRSGDQWVLVVERFDGVELGGFASDQPLSPERFLRIAIRIARSLAGVHGRRVVHRDLKPSSILVNPRTLEVCLVGFGLSVELEGSHSKLHDPGVVMGTLPYISPEQTGRTSLGIDARSDLYSLGAVFYQLLAGRRPFEGTEPMHLVHAHLAREPEPLDKLGLRVPETLARVVHRLLAKDPADRYQTAAALLRDLERCEARRRGDEIDPFEIAADDWPEDLALPARLYGRDKEREKLLGAFRHVARGGAEVVLLAGPPGIGKTALAHEVAGPTAERAGHFVAGKFEQGGRAPFLALRQVFTALVDQLLSEPEERRERWRERIVGTTGSLTGALCQLAPNLPRLLGPQLTPPELRAIESHTRAAVAVGRFLRGVASPRHPLVIFLDDLQWADPGSLRLLEHALERPPPGLLLLGAVREDPAGDLGAELRGPLTAAGLPPEHIPLDPLSEEAVAALLSDALRTEAEKVRPLATWLVRRAEGNPLQIHQTLRFLVDEGLLFQTSVGWTWTEEAIRGAGVPEDTAGVLQAKVQRLPESFRDVLVAASCAGSHFDVPSVAAALETAPVRLLPRLSSLCREGLLAEVGQSYRFTHDRIHDAARRFLDPERERSFHVRIGHFRRSVTPDEALPERAFEIVEHLEWSQETDRDFLLDLAHLEHLAGTRAIRGGTYATAERHLSRGLLALDRAIGSRPSRAERSRALALRIDRVRSISLAGRHWEAEQLYDELLAGDLTTLEVASVCAARVETSGVAGNSEDAIRWALHGLARCGLRIPRHPSRARLAFLALRVRWALRRSARKRLFQLEPCTDPVLLMRVELLARMSPSSFLALGDLLPVVTLSSALQVLRHGRGPHAPFALASAAGVIGGVPPRDIAGAGQVADAALELARGAPASIAGPPLVVAHAGAYPWLKPYRECLDELWVGFERSLDEGEIEWSCHALMNQCTLLSAAGGHLRLLGSGAERAVRHLDRAGMTSGARAFEHLVHLAGFLVDRAGYEAGEVGSHPRAVGLPSWRCVEALWAMQRLVFDGKPEQALEAAEPVVPVVDAELISNPCHSEFVFYRGMAAAMCAADGEKRRPGRRLRRAVRHARRRQRLWAKHCDANAGHKALLLGAELARMKGRRDEAFELYERAAHRAGQHDFTHMKALALERLGRMAEGLGRRVLAEASLREARDLYEAWGAGRVVARLESEFPALRPPEANPEVGEPESSSAASPALDIGAILAGSQAISRGLGHAEVVDRIMANAVKNAGAQRGVLVLERDDALYAEAEHTADGPTGRIHRGLPLEEAGALLPVTLVRRVADAGEPRVIAYAEREPGLAPDPYYARSGVRSILCTPMRGPGGQKGVLYLENRLVSGVFTPDRVEVMELLSGQAAISLENARLFDALRASEARKDLIVRSALDGVITVDDQGLIIEFNRAAEEMFGYPAEQIIGTPFYENLLAPKRRGFRAEYLRQMRRTLDDALSAGRRLEATVTRANGEEFPVEISITRAAVGDRRYLTGFVRDLTEQRRLQDGLRQASRLEAVGTLAGGVAHDFNNLLTVILGACELSLEDPSRNDEVRRHLEQIAASAQRGVALTRQLLTFSRKQILQPRVVDVNDVVSGLRDMLSRLIGENIEFTTELAEDLAPIRIDPGQMEQVVVNLVVNARDAMPRGGTLRIETENVLDIGPGRFVRLAVSDTGCGIDPSIRDQIFDPFFTTKEMGTGLGLSTAHGIVEQSGGHISVESDSGRGTRFEIDLPALRVDRDAPGGTPVEPVAARGSETILLVEDDDRVRSLVTQILESRGYRVLAASGGAEARAISGEAGAIDLVLTDVVMPGASGGEVAREQLELHPETRLLFMSGYTGDVITAAGGEDAPGAFLQKPFTGDSLARKVREVLDAPA